MASLLSWRALLVFVAAIGVDVVWGLYIRRAGEGRAMAAANFAVGIMLFGAINTISYTHNPWLLAPIVAGNWIGTFGIVRWDHRKKAAAEAA